MISSWPVLLGLLGAPEEQADPGDEDMDAWLASIEDEGEGGEAPVADDPSDDVFGGAMRLMGAYLHFPDVPEVYPDGDDALVAAIARVLAKDRQGIVGYEINAYLDLTRGPQNLFGGTFQTAGATASAYRTPRLTFDLWDEGSVSGQVGVDRFALTLSGNRVGWSIGRLAINHSVTGIFTPNDLFAPFSATAINTIYKPGVDATRLTVGLGQLSSLEANAVLGYDEDGDAAWSHSAALLRVSGVLWSFEWAALGGKVAQRWLTGASLQGDIDRFGVRAETHVGFPDKNGDGDRRGDDDIHVRVGAGPDVKFTWHNAVIGAEYGFWSDGAGKPKDYLQRAGRFFPDDLPYVGRHYVGATAGLDIIPIVRLQTLTLVNALDASGIVGAFLLYNIADEADFVAGAFVPWGKEPSFSTFPPDLGSEFGVSPLSVFLETRFFF